jgi:SPP1 family predicted phage head-tail adaptor
VVSQNDTGEEIIGWHHQGTVSARVEPASGNEAQIANATLTPVDTKIIVRWTPSMDQVSTKWRARNLTYGTIYNIQSVQNSRLAKHDIEIMVQSGLNEG